MKQKIFIKFYSWNKEINIDIEWLSFFANIEEKVMIKYFLLFMLFEIIDLDCYFKILMKKYIFVIDSEWSFCYFHGFQKNIF
jgi:hypothetical protein